MDVIACVTSCGMTWEGVPYAQVMSVISQNQVLGATVEFDINDSAAVKNSKIAAGAQAALTITYGVTFAPSDKFTLFGGAV